MGFRVVDKFIFSLLLKSYYLLGLAIIISAVTYFALHKSVNLYQSHLAKRVQKIKEYKNSYENELTDQKKKQKLEKKYRKSVKRLESCIKSVLAFNGRKIYIPTLLLNDESNLALKNEPAFTFKDKLYECINNRKHTTTVYEVTKGKKVISEAQVSQSYNNFNNKNENTYNNVQVQSSNLFDELKKLNSNENKVKFKSNFAVDNTKASRIYKTTDEDEETLTK